MRCSEPTVGHAIDGKAVGLLLADHVAVEVVSGEVPMAGAAGEIELATK
jgi:hypothetical protein